MNKTTNERIYVLNGTLEDGTFLFKTEYGSLLTEQMAHATVVGMFETARRQMHMVDKEQIRVAIEVTPVPSQEKKS